MGTYAVEERLALGSVAEGFLKIPGEQDSPIACPAKGAAFTQLLGVVGKGHFPA